MKKWRIVGKSEESEESGEKLGKVRKSEEKWGKVVKSGEKCGKNGE